MSTEHFGGTHNLPQSLPPSLLQNLPHLPNGFSQSFNSPQIGSQFPPNNFPPVPNDIESALPRLSEPSGPSSQAGPNLQSGSSAVNGGSSNSDGLTNQIGSQLTFPESWLVYEESENSNSITSGSSASSSNGNKNPPSGGLQSSGLPSSGTPSSGTPSSGSTSSAQGTKYIKLPPNVIPLGFNPSSSNLDSESKDGQIIIGTSNITSPYFYNVTSGENFKSSFGTSAYELTHFRFI